jgi:hypothetical protein
MSLGPRNMSVVVMIVLGLTIALMGSGCGGIDPAAGRAYLVAQIRQRTNAPERGQARYSQLEQLLPNALYRNGNERISVTQAVVFGHVAGVSKGFGFVVGSEDAAGGIETRFDDPEALWKTLHIAFRIERALGRATVQGGTIRVGLAVDGAADYRRLERGLRNLGSLVLFLRKGSPVFGYDRSLYAIVEDGGLIATVDSEGRLDLPMLSGTRVIALLANVRTLHDLEVQAAKPDFLVRAA